MLDRAFFETYPVVPSSGWEQGVTALWRAMERLTGTRVRLENLEALPRQPVLIATNSTQKYDFLPIRSGLRREGVPTVTVTKGKNYHQPVMGFLLKRLGVVPIASRGYLLLVDFVSTVGRRPTDEEYRALRSHVDEGTPLPEGEVSQRLESTARELLGYRFDPGAGSYRQLIRRVYAAVMGQTLRLSREAVEAGHHVQMYPEGTVSSRISEGRIGAVQMAWALKLPIVPAGMSGCRRAFRGQVPLLRGGEISIRFGRPYELPRDLLPADFVPFDPEHEARHKSALKEATYDLMSRLDGLVDPGLRRQEGFEPDGTRGTRRFL
jgi:1-acyl-sn-glycerol-3-phosphate acyltransferase